MKRKTTDTIRLLDEATALEKAGGTWTQKHASAITGYSVTYLRNSSCPKQYEDTGAIQGKPRVVYVPAEVRAWKASLRMKQAS